MAEVPSQTSSSASDQPPTSTSMLPYNQVTIHTGSKPPILISSSSTSPTRGTYTIPLTGKGDLRKDVGRFANSKSSGGISPHEGSQTSQHLYLKQNSGDDLPLSSADGAAPLADGQRFKIHIEHVNGDFYIMSDSKSSIVHLIKTASSVEAGNRCATHPKITSPPEAENEQVCQMSQYILQNGIYGSFVMSMASPNLLLGNGGHFVVGYPLALVVI